MIDHTGITVTNLEKSKAFYTKSLGVLGYVLCMNSPELVSFGVQRGHGKSIDPGGDFWLWEDTPMAPRPHFAFNAVSRADVDAFFSAGIAADGIKKERLVFARITIRTTMQHSYLNLTVTISKPFATRDNSAGR